MFLSDLGWKRHGKCLWCDVFPRERRGSPVLVPGRTDDVEKDLADATVVFFNIKCGHNEMCMPLPFPVISGIIGVVCIASGGGRL